jgi:hypothetical protein
VSRALYVYHRAPAGARADVPAAWQSALTALQAARPGLEGRLLRRCPVPLDGTPVPPADMAGAAGARPAEAPATPPADDTWMEIHERPGAGLDVQDAAALRQHLADFPPGRIGPRHEEWFDDAA